MHAELQRLLIDFTFFGVQRSNSSRAFMLLECRGFNPKHKPAELPIEAHWPHHASRYFPTDFKIFTNSACTYSLPHTTCPVFSASSSPPMPLTMPPASRTMMVPAARSQGDRLRSQ